MAFTDVVFPASDARLRIPVGVRVLLTVCAVVPAFLAGFGSWVLPALVVFDIVLATIALVDLETLKVPNRILGPAYLAALPLLTIAALGSGDWDRLAWAFGSAVVVFALFFGLWAASPRSLGMGDVKLAPYIALHLGWIAPAAVVLGLFAGAAVAALAGALAIQFWTGTWKSALPYAPFLAFGALIAQIVFLGGA